jgi:Flp pilus assembly protein TadG
MRIWVRRVCGIAPLACWKRSALRGEEGSELAEFAVSAGVLFMFVFGFIELCLVIFSYNTAAEAARNTARWLSIKGVSSCTPNGISCIPSAAAITAHVQSIPGAGQMTPTVQWCTGTTSCSATATAANAAAGDLVQVQVSYTYPMVSFVTSFLPSASQALTVTSTSQMVIWQ